MTTPPPAFMRLMKADGTTQDVPISGPGGTFRFGVGRSGHRSGTWRVWANKSTADVYLRSREVDGLHTSLHASGRWHHKFEDEQTALTFTGKADPYMDRWSRPVANDIGWTWAYSLWIPAEDVIDVPGDRQHSSKITWLPVPQPGHKVGVHVVVAQPDLGVAHIPDALPIEAFTLCNGEIALILVSYAEVGTEERTNLDRYRAQVQQALGEQMPPDDGHAYRTTLWAVREDNGTRMTYDLALYPQGVQ